MLSCYMHAPRLWITARAGPAGSSIRMLLVAAFCALLGHTSAAHWTHSAMLDPNYVVYWTPGVHDITFELQVRTLGYVGFGFSSDGRMAGADLLIGWVQNGKDAILQDRHGEERGQAVQDESQDYTLIAGYENGTHTVLRFRRRYQTCDPHDFPITNDTMRVLFAYHDEEPRGPGGAVRYHGGRRGARSLFLLARPLQQPPPPLHNWDLRNPNVVLPASESTVYWCKVFKLPPLHRKHHMVRYEPLLEPGNAAYVQHATLFECQGGQDMEAQARGRGQPCQRPRMPANCTRVVVAWAIGSQGFSYPPEAGYPLDPDEGPVYFLLETHYSKPDEGTDLTDSSGLRLYYTSSLRRHDAGVMSVGMDPNWRHIIPPGQPAVVSEGHCIPQCTRQSIPQHGIRVFATLLHTHLIGRKIRFRHIRNGEELEPIAVDNNSDFKYQEYRRIASPVKVYPGDHLMTECVYNSEDRPTITLGGQSTKEEMCLAYALYYPRTQLEVCHSLPSLPTVLHSLGIQELWQGSIPVMIKSPPELANMTLETRLLTFDWENNFWSFQDATRRGSFKPVCWRTKPYIPLPGTENLEAYYPNITTPPKEAASCWKKPRRRKKPESDDTDEDYDDDDSDEEEAEEENLVDASSSSSLGVQESSTFNDARRLSRSGALMLLASAVLFWR